VLGNGELPKKKKKGERYIYTDNVDAVGRIGQMFCCDPFKDYDIKT
jgi:hypothetical protein